MLLWHRPAAVAAAITAIVLAVPLLPSAAAAAPAAGSSTDCASPSPITTARFPARPDVDNRWFPLRPGTRFQVDGTVVENGVTHRHRIVTTVTGLTKRLDGVRTLVVLDEDYSDGVIQESELAFMAEDRSGRVWNVGEYPEEYSDGRLDGAPSTWVSGIAGASAGIGMPARPRTGAPAYSQGSAPSVGFHDCAKVIRTGQHVCVPRGCFDHVLVILEWDPSDPQGGDQVKYYAPGVGNIKVQARGGDTPENLRLTSLRRLHGHALARVDAVALAQDARGYRVSPDVYGRTPRAQRDRPCGTDR